MSSFKILYMPLDKNQIQYIKSCMVTLSVPVLLVNSKQVLAISDVTIDGYTSVPLTSMQVNHIGHCKDLKTDCTISLNLHQLQELVYINFNETIDISSKIIMFQSKKRIFKL